MSKSQSSKFKSCSRTVRYNKYERGSAEDEIWWGQLFKKLEKEFQIPADKRKTVINDIFPEKLVKKIYSILSFENELDLERDVTDKRGNPIYTEKSTVEIPAKTEEKEKREESVTHSGSKVESRIRDREAGSNNPYLNFFKRRPDRAAIWRELPPLALHEMNLTQKAEAITDAIATDFVNWLKTLGGDKKASLDVETIMNMFEIGFHMHAATSLCVKIKEMPSVTKEVALHRKLPQASYRASLRRQLKRDVLAATAGTSNVAFGKMLPKNLRCYRLKEDIVQKWIQSHRIPQDLATMAAVWQGIECLRSTRAFCAFLMEHPEVPEPTYLKNLGMLEPDFFTKGQRYSMESLDLITSGLAGVHTETTLPSMH